MRICAPIGLNADTNGGTVNSVSETQPYSIPAGKLGLKGPMVWPKPGTLPVRGDLAHIAMADRYLVPHYVVPHVYRSVAAGTEVRLSADPEAPALAQLSDGATFEVLDLAGDWYWGCVGPEGPTGYVAKAALEPVTA